MKHFHHLPALILALSFIIAGCGDDKPVIPVAKITQTFSEQDVKFEFSDTTTEDGEAMRVGMHESTGAKLTVLGAKDQPRLASLSFPFDTNMTKARLGFAMMYEFAASVDTTAKAWLAESIQEHDLSKIFTDSAMIGGRRYFYSNIPMEGTSIGIIGVEGWKLD